MYYYNARFERTAVNNLLDFSDKEAEIDWTTGAKLEEALNKTRTKSFQRISHTQQLKLSIQTNPQVPHIPLVLRNQTQHSQISQNSMIIMPIQEDGSKTKSHSVQKQAPSSQRTFKLSNRFIKMFPSRPKRIKHENNQNEQSPPICKPVRFTYNNNSPLMKTLRRPKATSEIKIKSISQDGTNHSTASNKKNEPSYKRIHSNNQNAFILQQLIDRELSTRKEKSLKSHSQRLLLKIQQMKQNNFKLH